MERRIVARTGLSDAKPNLQQVTDSINIIIPARNEEKVVAECLSALLANDHPDFHVTLIDDASTDNTAAIAQSFACSRLTILTNAARKGQGASVNEVGLASTARYLFFLDADCVPEKDWISQGLAAFNEPNVCAVEGAIYYAVPQPSFRHKIPINPFYNSRTKGLLTVPGRDFASGNFGIDRKIFAQLGGFDARRYSFGREDTDLGFRAKKLGIVAYNPRMKVVHKEEFWNFKSLLSNAKRYGADVHFYKDHGCFPFRWRKVLHPELLLLLLAPPLILFKYPVRRCRDFLFLPQFYVYLMKLRYVIWRQAIQERLFVL